MVKYEFRRDYGGYRTGDIMEMSDKRARRLKLYIAKVAEQAEPTLGELLIHALKDDKQNRPATNANKAAWIDYAISQGLSTDEADSMTKADLIAHYTDGDD